MSDTKAKLQRLEKLRSQLIDVLNGDAETTDAELLDEVGDMERIWQHLCDAVGPTTKAKIPDRIADLITLLDFRSDLARILDVAPTAELPLIRLRVEIMRATLCRVAEALGGTGKESITEVRALLNAKLPQLRAIEASEHKIDGWDDLNDFRGAIAGIVRVSGAPGAVPLKRIVREVESLKTQADNAKERFESTEDKLRAIDNMVRSAGMNGPADILTRVSRLIEENARLTAERHRVEAYDFVRSTIEGYVDGQGFVSRDSFHGPSFDGLVRDIVQNVPVLAPQEAEQALVDGYRIMTDLMAQRDAATHRAREAEAALAGLDDEIIGAAQRFPVGSPEPMDVMRVHNEQTGVVFDRVQFTADDAVNNCWRASKESGGDGSFYTWRALNGDSDEDGVALVEHLG